MYMDHSATAPVREEVFEVMKPYFTRSFGNASTFYSLGREAKAAMEESRKHVANIIGANKDEIIFTSGGTESDNIAIQGIAYKLKNADKGNHIITSAIEHPAVMETCAHLEKKGFEVTYLPVYEDGIVKIEDLKSAIKDETILITIMHANNEIGTIQPIAEIGKIAKEKKIKFHTDAVQSVGKIPVDVNEMNVDLLSISSHKVFGPKGIGALYIRKGTRLEPILYGGGQEMDLSPGTENIPGIVGLGEACRLAKEELNNTMEYTKKLRDKLVDGVLNSVEKSYINGNIEKRLPGNVNFRFTGIEGESIVLMLDAKGIASSTGSACSSKKLTASHVLKAIGLEDVDSHGSLRLTIGPENTEEEVDIVIKEIPPIIEKLRSMSSIWNKDKDIWKNNTESCDI
ncbi:cysteine desulfurase NifS [Methanobrevibacter sp. TMH8]|uniref:cysteine desulfurase NifS n=1 Tax=Methanobrevibacter sp. TMH8 TaxID=2848611 RepID=UPI001CCD41B4|nr:cysteine desulfurase NifS [Methanobrevibacter sp. TMH8]